VHRFPGAVLMHVMHHVSSQMVRATYADAPYRSPAFVTCVQGCCARGGVWGCSWNPGDARGVPCCAVLRRAVPCCAVLCIGKGPTGLSTMTGMACGTPTGTWMQEQQQAWQQ
jgi:hypothetical protein